jgi:hypothetical protein
VPISHNDSRKYLQDTDGTNSFTSIAISRRFESSDTKDKLQALRTRFPRSTDEEQELKKSLRASTSIYLLPFFGLILSILMVHEHITAPQIEGGLLTLFSTVVLTLYDRKTPEMASEQNAD